MNDAGKAEGRCTVFAVAALSFSKPLPV